ncbi:C1QL [Mytilus coruscus]|uniref:C1QL n=1 Tax=Mytilus coruscus TaxID=42192 RepID=A0A6J7ZYM2_MYTCO|nr:C1QL [Mytilus coruscus]
MNIAQFVPNTPVTSTFCISVMFLSILYCVLSFCSVVQNTIFERETSGNGLLWIIAKQLDRLENKVQDMQKQYISRDKEIETIKETLQGQSKELGGVKTPKVVFKARDLKTDANLIGKHLVFPNMIVNHGGGYNRHTGVFTAPVSGIYLFNIQLCPEPKSSIHMHIKVKNTGKVIGDLQFYSMFGVQCVSANGVDFLSQGEQAWVQCTSASSSGDVIVVGSHGNSFSGVLVHV